MRPSVAFKIFTDSQWAEFQTAGRFDGAPVDLADGYIHMSAKEQIKETAARHFADQDNLVIAMIDLTKLGKALKWEESRNGDFFPHYYGSLELSAVLSAGVIQLGADGKHRFPNLH